MVCFPNTKSITNCPERRIRQQEILTECLRDLGWTLIKVVRQLYLVYF